MQSANFFPPGFGPGGTLNGPAIVYFDDFLTGYTVDAAAGDDEGYKFAATADKADWFISHDTLDAATQLPIVQDDQDGGVIKFTTDATSGERISAQLNGENFRLVQGREMRFAMRCKFTNTTQDGFFGVSVNTTDPHASRPAGFVAFTLTGDADIEYATGNASTATASADSGADIVADTWTVLSWHYKYRSSGSGYTDKVTFYKDGIKIVDTILTIPTGIYMSPVFCLESNGAAESMFIDWIYCMNERA